MSSITLHQMPLRATSAAAALAAGLVATLLVAAPARADHEVEQAVANHVGRVVGSHLLLAGELLGGGYGAGYTEVHYARPVYGYGGRGHHKGHGKHHYKRRGHGKHHYKGHGRGHGKHHYKGHGRGHGKHHYRGHARRGHDYGHRGRAHAGRGGGYDKHGRDVRSQGRFERDERRGGGGRGRR